MTIHLKLVGTGLSGIQTTQKANITVESVPCSKENIYIFKWWMFHCHDSLPRACNNKRQLDCLPCSAVNHCVVFSQLSILFVGVVIPYSKTTPVMKSDTQLGLPM